MLTIELSWNMHQVLFARGKDWDHTKGVCPALPAVVCPAETSPGTAQQVTLSSSTWPL